MALSWKGAAGAGALGVAGLYAGNKKFRQGTNKFLFGSPDSFEEQSLLRKEQEPLYQQMVNAGLGEGAGGAFGTSADYYRNLLSNDSEDFNAFAAPEMRRFNEETVPGLARQFAGYGAGASGLSGSGFRNAAVGAGVDLSERLGQLRAQLRQQGAQGLMNIGQAGLGQYKENIYRPRTPGLIEQLAPIAGQVASAYVGGKVGMPEGTPGAENTRTYQEANPMARR